MSREFNNHAAGIRWRVAKGSTNIPEDIPEDPLYISRVFSLLSLYYRIQAHSSPLHFATSATVVRQYDVRCVEIINPWIGHSETVPRLN